MRPVAWGRGRRPAGDDGQVLLLALGYVVLALVLATAVASASAVHLERKRLLVLADLTALSAAGALDRDAYYARGSGSADGLVVLTPASVRAAAERHLASAPEADAFEDLTLVRATTADGRTAGVTLAARARPVLPSWATAAWSTGIPLQVTGVARAG